MNLDSMQEIVAAAKREGKPFWESILETDMKNRGVSRGNSLDKMAQAWHVMREASQVYTGERRSLSGLAGGQGKQMHDYASTTPIGGEFMAQVIAEALSMGPPESHAGADWYLVDRDFTWTCAHTHEVQCGPYFCRPAG